MVLMLVSVPGGSPGQALCGLLTVPPRTVSRWRAWWGRDFACTAFWHSVRGHFAVPVVIAGLPGSLLERFTGTTLADRMLQLLRFIAPLSTQAIAM
ncbi:MAG: hypothetical protein ACRELE_05890 [Gemmatimonadales bacterium]